MRAPTSVRTALLASTALVPLALTGLGAGTARAQGVLPTGGRVVAGGVNIGTPSGGALTIRQSTGSAIVNWQRFSIGQNNRVDIVQPNAQAAILNRVTGATRSTIAGQLNANGQVYLVNPNGITITRTGKVNAGGGFVGSTLGISDEDFKAGRRAFRGSGGSAGVTNRGSITVGRGGYAALIGGKVANSGTISVPMGRVGLGSGEQATLDLSGDGFLQVAMPTGGRGRGPLVSNSGVISADGGSVTLSAAAARDLARHSINLSGTIEARSVSGRNGSITLSGGEGAVRVAPTARIDASGAGAETGGRVRITGGRLDVAGTVDVSGARGGKVALRGTESLALSGQVIARGTGGTGGRVSATAPTVTTRAALIDASGATGGSVRVGGGFHGEGRLAHARNVDVDGATTFRADATRTGTGGSVVVWSDESTRFAGIITARGGPNGGNGGLAEVSSKGVLDYTGSAVLTAPQGGFGTLLLDPYNVTITAGPDSNHSASFVAIGNDSNVNATTLSNALNSANVTVSTNGGGGGTQAGTIEVAAPVSSTAGTTLTLNAAGYIALNANVSVTGLVLRSGADIVQTGGVLTVSNLTVTAGGSTALTAANGITTLTSATFGSAGSGSLTIANGRSLQVTGSIIGGNTATGGVSLTALGNLSLGQDLVSGTVSLRAQGGTLTVPSVTTTNNGAITLQATSFTFNNNSTDGGAGRISSGTGATSLLIEGGGSVGETGTVPQAGLNEISAGRLVIQTVGGAADLTLNTVDLTSVSSVQAIAGRNLVLGDGKSVSALTLALQAGGTITQGASGVLSARTLSAAATGGAISLTGSSNGIGTVSGLTTGSNGAASLTTTSSLTLAGDVNLGTGTLTLSSTGGTITQTAGTITAGTLSGTSRGDASFTRNNAIATLGSFAATSNGNVSLTTSVPTLGLSGDVTSRVLTLNNVGGGINQNGGTIRATVAGSAAGNASFAQAGADLAFSNFSTSGNGDLSATARSISFSGPVNIGAGTLSLNATNGTISQDNGTVTITAGTLTGSSQIGTTLNLAANVISNLGAFTDPSLTGVAVKTSVPNFQLTGTVNAPGALTLVNAGGAISQAGGSITTGTLTLTAAGDVALSSAANSIATLASASVGTGGSGGLTLVDNRSLQVTGAITVGNATGGVSLTAAGNLSLYQDLTAAAVTLRATGGTLTIPSVTATNGPITLEATSFSFNGSSTGAAGEISSGTATTSILIEGSGSVGETGTLPTSGLDEIRAGRLVIQAVGSTSDLTINNVDFASTPVQAIAGRNLTLADGRSVTATSLALQAGGAITQGASGALTAQSLSATATGGAISLAGSQNSINTVAGLTTSNAAASLTTGSNLTVAGDVSLGTGTLTLNSSGSIVQTAGTISAGALSGSSSGGASFLRNNAVASLGAFTDGASGNLSLVTSAATLGLTGAVNLGTGTLTLTNSGGTISQTAGAITAGTLSGSSVGSASFTKVNTIATLGAFTATNNGDLSLVSSRPALALAGTVGLGIGTLTLVNTSGTINQAGGAITAGTLTGQSSGGASFTGANAVSNLGAFADTSNGNLSLTTSRPTLGLTGTVGLGTGTLTLNNTGGAIAQTFGAITAGTLTGQSAGGASFTRANTVSNLGAFTDASSGSLSLNTSVATLGLTGAIGIGTGTLTLNNTGGTIAQTFGAITAGTLSGSSAGAATFSRTTNAIGTLGGFSAGGSLSLTDTVALTLAGSVSAGNGGTLTLTQLGTGANGTIAQVAGAVTAGTLTGSSNGAASFGQSGNAVGAVGAFATGGGNFTLATLGDLGVTGAVNAGSGRVSLTTSGGSLTQLGSSVVTGGSLNAAAARAITLTGANVVSTLISLQSASSDASFTNAAAFVVAGGVGAGRDVRLVSTGGGISIASGASVIGGSSVLIAANGNVTNNAGANAVQGSSWSIYTQNSANPTGSLPTNSFGGLAGSNYYNDAFSFTSGTFASAVPNGNHFVYAYAASVTPTLSGNASKTYDGTTTAPTSGLTLSPGALVNANGVTDTATLAFSSASYDTANAGTGKTVTANGLSLTSNPNNYTLAPGSSASASVGVVGQATITVAGATGVNKVYDSSTALPAGASGFTATGIVASDSGRVSVNASGAAYDSPDAGPRGVLVSGLNLTGSASGNYVLSSTSVTGSGTITPATITVAGASGVNKVYDSTTALPAGATGFTASGILGPDSSRVTVSAGNAAYDSAEAGQRSVSVSGLTLTGAAAGNYRLSATTVTGSGTIGRATITVAGATGVDKVYDGTTALPAGASGFTSTGVYGSDAGRVAVSAGSASYDSANAGGRSVLVSGLALSGAGAGNYALSSTSATGSGTISPATLTYVANGAGRLYGAANPALTGTVTGFVGGETQGSATTGTLAFTTGAGVGSNVGTYAVTGSGLSARNGNYVFAQAAGNASALTINPAPLTVTGAKTYDTTTSFATGQLAVSGGQNGETVSLTGGTGSAASADSGSYAGSPLSGLAIAVAGGNARAGNYSLPATGTLAIGRATIMVAGATGVDKVYDGTTALPAGASGFTSTGVYGSDAGRVAVSAGSASYDSANAGGRSVLVSGLALSGAGAGNYALSSTSATGSGTISPATLTYVANGAGRLYGAANPALTGTVTGFVGGETQGSATTGTLAFTTGAGMGSNVGTYAVTGSGLSARNGNYVFAQAAGNASALTINPAPLTVTGAKTYDTTTGFTTAQLAVSGGQNGETVSLTGGTGSAASADAGSYAGSPLSGLAIAVSGGNARAGNYSLPATGTLAIGQRPISVTANAQSRTYGDANPELTYRVGGQGLVGGDTLSGNLTTAAISTSTVGSYGITQGSLTASANYAVTFTGANLTVTPRPITALADAQGRIYGDANPLLTYQVGGRGLVNSDTLSGSLATSADPRSGVGVYSILQGSLAASANYSLSYGGAGLAVAPRPLTIIAAVQARPYGGTPPDLTFVVGGRGLVNGDTLTGSLAAQVTNRSGPGNYAITLGSLTAGPNYSVTLLGADIVVTPAPVGPDGLASTLDRTIRLERGLFGTAADALPEFHVPAERGGLLLSDPRFDKTLVCLPVPGGCAVAPLAPTLPRPPEPMPGPQASLRSPAPR